MTSSADGARARVVASLTFLQLHVSRIFISIAVLEESELLQLDDIEEIGEVRARYTLPGVPLQHLVRDFPVLELSLVHEPLPLPIHE